MPAPQPLPHYPTTLRRGLIAYVLAALLLAMLAVREPLAEPVTVDNCGRSLTFAEPPSRAVSHDMNISEIMFALGLQDRMVGVTGISGWYKMTPEFRRAMGSLPELVPKYPTIETLLAVEPDFFFAGWYYGMKPGGAVTPETLGEFGVPVYVLSESCVHFMEKRPRASMETLYGDVLNIGRIFKREAEAQALVDSYRTRVRNVEKAVRGKPPPRVFLFDSGEEKPFTAGKYAMPTAIVEAAGGRNVMDDVETSWGRVGWEPVIERDPEFIIMVGYQDASWRDRWQFLRENPALNVMSAVREERFLVVGYTEITPGPNNIPATEKLARALHPDRFP